MRTLAVMPPAKPRRMPRPRLPAGIFFMGGAGDMVFMVLERIGGEWCGGKELLVMRLWWFCEVGV